MAKTQTTEKVKKNTTNEFEVTRTVIAHCRQKKELMKEIEKLEGVLQDKRKGAGIDSLEAEIAKKSNYSTISITQNSEWQSKLNSSHN